MDSQKLIAISGILIMAVWVITMLDGVVTNRYEPMQVSTPVMVIYAGFLFARGGLGKKGDS